MEEIKQKLDELIQLIKPNSEKYNQITDLNTIMLKEIVRRETISEILVELYRLIPIDKTLSKDASDLITNIVHMLIKNMDKSGE